MHHDTSSICEAPVLVAMDLGERCRECLEQAWRIARQRGQTLIIAHVAHETVQIVIGHSQPSGVAGMLQRTTGQTVLNTAPCPVFLLDGLDLVGRCRANAFEKRTTVKPSLRTASPIT